MNFDQTNCYISVPRFQQVLKNIFLKYNNYTQTFNDSLPGLPIWILLKQETVSGSGIS